jgi:hypothetical protein
MNKLTPLLIAILLVSTAAAQVTVTQTVHANLVAPPPNSEVAYVYKFPTQINQKIINILNADGFDVTLISEKDFSKTNFTKFRFIFIGDESFTNAKRIPVDKVPTIVFNHFNVQDFGLAKKGGASQLGSTSPLSVTIENKSIQVYTKAFKIDRISAPYYYLGRNNIAPSLEKIAFAKPTSAGSTYGTVIAHAESGDKLANGKTAKANICFFGITETNFWTTDAKNLFNDCVEFVAF